MKTADLSGLPPGAVEHLRSEGIEELYPPQADAVDAGVLEGENLVAAVPTASGKTLIATLAMLSSIERGGTALYVVPLRALASEKQAEFEAFEAFGVSVGVSTGNYDADGEWLASKDIVVATSEKVDSLLRNGAPWLRELSCVVADEVHLIDDADRGPTLEVTLAKLRQVCPGLQTVALSATVGNADEIADWLDAALIDTDWRPIELRRGVHYGNALHLEGNDQRELAVGPGESQTAAIVRDTLEEGGSSLVFVNSRKNAAAAARRLSGVTEPFLTGDERTALADLADELRDVSDTEASEELADAVEGGAAFHHAGLASEHRRLVEEAFRERLLTAIAATPTLAAGVNTPSRRVVVRDWRRYAGAEGGMVPLDVLEVHQMMGRAGRPGRDPHGEAVLLASSHEELEGLFDRYIYADPEPVRSKLAAEPALRTHVLATVATGFATTREELLGFLDRTLYASQADEPGRLVRVVDDVVDYLVVNEFLERDGGAGEELTATGLGHTVSRQYLDPMSAAEIDAGLSALGAGERPTALGLYHLVSRTPDTYELYLRSGDRERYTETCYEREDELLGPVPNEFEEVRFEQWLSALKTARLLEDWADEVDEEVITERYGVGPGDIRGKVETADWLLAAAESIADERGLDCAPAIADARRRVADGVREELLELVRVRGVGRVRARRLYDAGIADRNDLREADKSVILGALQGREATTETVLANAGREDPSVEGVTPDPQARHEATASEADTADDGDGGQTSLGEFR